MTNVVNNKPSLLSESLEVSSSLAKGLENFGRIGPDSIEVGATKKHLVAEFDKVKLYRYEPFENTTVKTAPVLVCYGLIGSYKMIDIQHDRSLVRNLLSRGVDVYVIDWGYPTLADKFLSFDDYVGIYLDDCVDLTCSNANIDQINLFGICEGGVFTTMYAAHHPEKVANLILSITPIDFAAYKDDKNPSHGLINLWVDNIDDADIEALIDSYGNLPGEIMGGLFNALTPVKTLTKYNLDMIDIIADDKRLDNFLRMEKWLAERPNHPGVAAKQWLIDLYKNNKMVKGEFKVLDELVDLNDISMPVLNLYAEHDHIVPPPCSTALKKYVGSQDYTDMPIKGGHVGIYVSSRLQDIVGDGIFDWLETRQPTP